MSFASYDRLFPTQDTVPKGGFGNLIALPFQGQAQKDGNTLFVDPQYIPYPDQWAFLSTLPKISPEQLSVCLSDLCENSDVGQLIEVSEEKPWPRRHSRKQLTKADLPIQARLMVSDMVYVDKQGFSQTALNAIKRLAAFPNPEFRLKQAMRLPVYRTPRVLHCSYEDDGFLGVPRGCLEPLTQLLDEFDIPAVLEDRRCAGRAIDLSFAGTLRPEQEPAAKALLAENIGVLSATTAFGKTVIGAYLIGRRKVNTLILAHSSALLEQWKNSLEQFLEIRKILPEQPKKRGREKKLRLIGQIGSGRNTRGGIVDIAIMQSLFEGKEKDVKNVYLSLADMDRNTGESLRAEVQDLAALREKGQFVYEDRYQLPYSVVECHPTVGTASAGAETGRFPWYRRPPNLSPPAQSENGPALAV